MTERGDVLRAPSLPRSYWVSFPRLLAGAYPGSPQPEGAREKLRALYEAGIRTIVNLTEEVEIGHEFGFQRRRVGQRREQ